MTGRRRPPLRAMLRAGSVAIVGASPRPGSFGERMVAEVSRGRDDRAIYLVNPRYDRIGDRPCVASMSDVGAVDLVLLGVGDSALDKQLQLAADAGARSAVIFGSAHGEPLRESLRRIADSAGMSLCGAGCMGFVNVPDRLRAIGYQERAELPAGPIGLVTHSGSVFSALLRTRRALGYTVAVSSGQELVTSTADYLDYLLDETDTGIVALVLETVRDGPRLLDGLRRAAARDVPVVLLPVGASRLGSELVAAHSGALAGDRATWEALAEATGALLVADLGELTDTLELLAVGPRPRAGRGIASVHDSGAERTLVADLAEELGVPFAPLGGPTVAALARLLDDGLLPENPLDLWGVGADTRRLFAESMRAVGADPAVSVVALAVDLVEEYDGDTAYVDAALDVHDQLPLVVLANLAAAIDGAAAHRLRSAGVPVLEGTRSGLVALRHLLARAEPGVPFGTAVTDADRRCRWASRLGNREPLAGAESFALLADYGLPVVAVRAVASADAAAAAAAELTFPVVLKTDAPGIAHKSDVGGVVVGLADEAAVRAAYQELDERLGPRALVSATVQPGVELALGVVRDPQLGPLVVIAAGGVLAELLTDRVVAVAPISPERAERLLRRLRVSPLLDGIRGAAPVDLAAAVAAIVAVGELAAELGDLLDAVDVNPVICGPTGAVAVDALVVGRTGPPAARVAQKIE